MNRDQIKDAWTIGICIAVIVAAVYYLCHGRMPL